MRIGRNLAQGLVGCCLALEVNAQDSSSGMSSVSMSGSMPMSSSTSMSMSMSSSASMSMPMSSSSASMSMPMSSSSASKSMSMSSSASMSMSMSSASAMDMSGDMQMNTYLTPQFKGYPVLFNHLNANTKAQAFGIFVLVIAAAFAYKFLLFTSWCLEVKWFKQWNPTAIKSGSGLSAVAAPEDPDNSSLASTQNYIQDLEFQTQYLPKVPNLLVHVVSPSVKELCHDVVRLLITFCSTMLIYMLMLVTMTFVLTYVFAVVLGISLAEIFFNRWKICLLARWELQRELEKKRNCNGGDICPCDGSDPAKNASGVTAGDESSGSSSILEKPENNINSCEIANTPSCCCAPEEASSANVDTAEACCCDGTEAKNEAIKERQARELSSSNEQSGTMDVTLIPADKFS
ncbi:LADA_0B05270g1_1 [Lachancea dasiensis]|uniref:Copper transport protein n=1 Tax=Lachancea dasiensis TaxID=1072105 RepID=A0A1G4ITL9_9SACH|nr:LADA_0B05270g1_1 [Lachancea dasiensis]